MSLEPFAAPAWLIALATAFFLGAKAVVAVKGGNGKHLAPELSNALQAVTITLTRLTERLEHLPTKEELLVVAEKNRHSYRDILADATDKIVVEIGRSEQGILKEIQRRPA